jgi:hypothetical protein
MTMDMEFTAQELFVVEKMEEKVKMKKTKPLKLVWLQKLNGSTVDP